MSRVINRARACTRFANFALFFFFLHFGLRSNSDRIANNDDGKKKKKLGGDAVKTKPTSRKNV